MRKPSASGALGSGVVVLCAYEMAALTSRRLPTVSALCREHRWLEAAMLAVLLAHLHHQPRIRVILQETV